MATLNESNSLTDIANTALVLVKETMLSNIDEDSDKAKAIRQVIVPCIYLVQASMEWAELLRTETLALADTQLYEGRYKYHKPKNFIKVESVINKPNADCEVEGNYLYIPANEVKIRYYKKNLNPASWGDELKECVTLKLAAKLATYLSNDYSIGGQLEERYETFQRPILGVQKEKRRSNIKTKKKGRSWLRGRTIR